MTSTPVLLIYNFRGTMKRNMEQEIQETYKWHLME